MRGARLGSLLEARKRARGPLLTGRRTSFWGICEPSGMANAGLGEGEGAKLEKKENAL